LRNAARGLAIAGARPAGVIKGLAQLTLMDEAYGYATALYGLLDADHGELQWSSAGHIPPLAFGPGAARWLSFADHPPFGLPTVSNPSEQRHQLAPGEGIVLWTDGVVERRGADIVEGLELLRQLVARQGGASAR
jgi:two-component system, chemotaxis family, sensor kinase Cph1